MSDDSEPRAFAVEIRHSGETPGALGARMRDALRTAKLVHVTGVPAAGEDALGSFYESVCDGIGTPFRADEDTRTGAKTGGRWIHIRYDERHPDRYRHAPVGQPLHTDMAYTRRAPDVPLMYCVSQAAEGGETIFLDAEFVAEALRRMDPELHEGLLRTPVRFRKADFHAERPVLRYDASGAALNWLYTCVDRSQPSDVLALAERFFAFAEAHLANDPRIVPVALAPGDAVAWRDERLLHGRRAYRATRRGERHLCKTALFLGAT